MTLLHQSTRAVRSGLQSDTQHGAVVPPLHLSANFTFAGFSEPRPYDYTRSGNPTRDLLGCAIADLEGGATGVVTASGMAAVNLVTQLVRPHELIVAPGDCYGGTWRLLVHLAERGRFSLCLFDPDDENSLEEVWAKKPALVWLETPSNPLLRITDIAAVAAAAKTMDALVVVDNTFLSPALQQPLALGADIVVHSTTKYINGHSDVVGGAVVTKAQALGEELAWWANCLGLTGAPFDSFLTLRGLRTLAVRMRQHQENAAAVVEALKAHPAVRRVLYPGLDHHPGHDIAARQQRGFGGMVSFELACEASDVGHFLTRLRCFSLAESLGGVESLVAHPATMTHAAMSQQARHRAGISDTLIRLSVGIEDPRDLVADLRGALANLRLASAA